MLRLRDDDGYDYDNFYVDFIDMGFWVLGVL